MKVAAFNRMAHEIADHVNADFARCGQPSKVYIFAMIAADLGLPEDVVRDAISDGGYNGITLRRRET